MQKVNVKMKAMIKSHFVILYVLVSSLRIPGKGAPSMFPNRVPMDRDTLSPGPLVHSFIHSCMYARVPKKELSNIWGGGT